MKTNLHMTSCCKRIFLLQEALETLDMANRRFMIITDSNVEKFYLRELKDIIQKCEEKWKPLFFLPVNIAKI